MGLPTNGSSFYFGLFSSRLLDFPFIFRCRFLICFSYPLVIRAACIIGKWMRSIAFTLTFKHRRLWNPRDFLPVFVVFFGTCCSVSFVAIETSKETEKSNNTKNTGIEISFSPLVQRHSKFPSLRRTLRTLWLDMLAPLFRTQLSFFSLFPRCIETYVSECCSSNAEPFLIGADT